MKKYFIVVMFVFVLFFFTGCDNKKNNASPIVGKWIHGSYVYVFNEDMTCSCDVSTGSKKDCTYKLKGDKVTIIFKNDKKPFETTYKIEKDKLFIKDSYDMFIEYKKSK